MAEAQSEFPWSEPLFPIFNELVEKGKQIFHDSDGTALINFGTPSEIILYLTAREVVGTNVSPPNDFLLCVVLGNDLLQCISEEDEEPSWKIFINDSTYFDTGDIASAVASYDYRGYDANAFTKVELVKKLFIMLNNVKKLSSVNFVNILLGIQQITSSGIFNNIRDISKGTMLSKYKESTNKSRLAILFDYISLFSNQIVYKIDYNAIQTSADDKFVIHAEISTSFDVFARDGKFRLPFDTILKYLLNLTKSESPGLVIDRTSIVTFFDILEFCYQIIIENLSNVHVITRNNQINYNEFLEAMTHAMTDANGAGENGFRVENINAILARKRADFREAAAAQAAAAATNQSEKVQLNMAARLAARGLIGGKRKKASRLRSSKKHSLRRNKSRRNKSRRKNKSRRNK